MTSAWLALRFPSPESDAAGRASYLSLLEGELESDYFLGSSSGCTYVSWKGPIACTCTSVIPRVVAKCAMFAGAVMKPSSLSKVNLALAWASVSDVRKALECLERESFLVYWAPQAVWWDPRFDQIRDEPRFARVADWVARVWSSEWR